MKESYFQKLTFIAFMHDFFFFFFCIAVVLIDLPGLRDNEVHISGHASLFLFLCHLVAFLHHYEKTMGLRVSAVCSTLEHIPVKHTARWQVTHLCGRAGDPHLTLLPSPPSSDLPPASNWLVWVGAPTRQNERWGFGRCLPQAFYSPPSLAALLPAVQGVFLSSFFPSLNRIDCLVWLQGQRGGGSFCFSD